MHEQVRPGRVFLDDQLRPYPDDQQWTYLASVQRIDRRTVETIAGEAKKAACALLAHEIGAFVAPPGVGKTVVGTYLAAERRCSTLILVHRQPLLDQWIAQLSLFLGVDVKEIGQIGAGKRSANGRLDVAMLQSLVRSGKVSDLVASYGQVIVDECHHVPAVSFERVLAEVKARFVAGLTATPQRRDGLHPIIEMQIGPARFVVDPKSQAARRPWRPGDTSVRVSMTRASTRCFWPCLFRGRARSFSTLAGFIGFTQGRPRSASSTT